MDNYLAELVKDVTLTKSQKKIAEYFIQNTKAICTMSSMEVAGEIGVSDASIIRFSRAIGFEGFSDLKEHVYASLMEDKNRLPLSKRMSRNKEEYQGADMASYLNLLHENVFSAFEDNRVEDFEAIAQGLVDAKRRYIVGMRGLRGLALKVARLMSFMLSEVHLITDGECLSINNLQDIEEGDVLLLFIFSRFYKIDLSYAKMAHEKGAKVFLITNEVTGPLTPYADVLLMAGAKNCSFFHSTLAVDAMAEYILNLITERVEFNVRMDEQDAITSDQRL